MGAGTTSNRRRPISCTVSKIVEEIPVFGCGRASGMVTIDVRRSTCRSSDRIHQGAEARETAVMSP